MAPKKHETDDELTIAEDESDDSSVEEDSESEEEVLKSTPNSIPQSDSEGEDNEREEEGSEDSAEERSQRSVLASDFIVKPNNLTKHAEKDSNPALKRPLESRNPTLKRPLESRKDEAKESITTKKANIGVENVKDKVSSISAAGHGGGGRVWSPVNELALLHGVIDYRNEKGSDPYANLNAFTDFVKGNLFQGVKKSQIYVKLRRLEEKFLRNLGKGENGRDPVFSNPREFETFELSKKVWGGGIKRNELEHKTQLKSNNVEGDGKVQSNLSNSRAKESMGKEKTRKDEKVILAKERTKKNDKGGSFVNGVANSVEDNAKVKSNLLSSKARAIREKETMKKDDKTSMEKEITKKNGKGSMEKESTKRNGKASMKKENTKRDDKVDGFVDGLADGVDMNITNGNQRVDGSSDFLSNYPNLGASFDVKMSLLKDKLHLIGDIKGKELEEGWTRLRIEEMDLASKRLSLMAKQTKLVLDAVNKG